MAKGRFVQVPARGGYGRLIDYRLTPPPPVLSPEEAAWVKQLLS